MQHPMVAAAILLFVFSSSASVRSQDTNPTKANCVSPRVILDPPADPSHYPKKDKVKAVIDILVDEKGRVRNPMIVTSSGSKEFDLDAIGAVQRWRFKPSRCDGKPTAAHITVEMESQVVH